MRIVQRQVVKSAAVAVVLTLALAAAALVRVAATHRVYAATLDEPIHLAAGFEWFHGDYTVDMTHPPLARIVAALPLYLGGFPETRPSNMVDRGNQLLYHGERYEETLALARRGNLLFLLTGIAVVALWTWRLFGSWVSVAATALFTAHPLILGHAGVVTTDMAIAATFPLALFVLDLYLARPSMRRALAVGIALGLLALSKFSAVVFFPPAALVLIVFRLPARPRLRDVIAALALALLVVWAGYRFHVERPERVIENGANIIEWAAPSAVKPLAKRIAQLPLPAPELVIGVAQVKLHDGLGHGGYLLGREYRNGWWPYFPVLLFYKSPLPWLFFAAWGALLAFARRERPSIAMVIIAAAILAVAATSTINIGARHILPIFAPLSIVAGTAVIDIARRSRDAFGRLALIALLVWLFGGVAAAHPDYLPWFNETAQPNPSRIAVDSNLDWGQDVLRLADVVRRRNIEHLHTSFFTPLRLASHGINATPLTPHQPVSGWVAVSEHQFRFTEDSGDFDWLSIYRPVERVGESIRLYYIP